MFRECLGSLGRRFSDDKKEAPAPRVRIAAATSRRRSCFMGLLWRSREPGRKRSENGLTLYGIRCPRGWEDPRGLVLTDFRLLRAIGHGCASTVFEAIHLASATACVIKICMKTRLHRDEEHRFRREMTIHSALDHPHILRFYASFEDVQAFYIVMEQAEKGDLLNYIRRKYRGAMPLPKFRARVLEPLLGAVHYLHKQAIIHRDIKPENILVARDGTIKLCDFGFSINSYDERPKSYVGTLEYMAPEILEKKTHLFSEKLDIWAIGVLTYECLVGVSPFHMANEQAIIGAILDGKYFLPSAITNEIAGFLKRCLHPNPERRATVKELMRFIKGGGGAGAGDAAAAERSGASSAADVSASGVGTRSLSYRIRGRSFSV